MAALEDAVDAKARDTAFSGVVRVDRSGTVEFAKAYGLADRGNAIPNTIETQFAVASAAKGLTALAVVRLIEDGSLHLDTTARSYGMAFWLHGSSDVVMLEGYDAGVSFRSVHNPGSATTHTVISNTTEGAWPITSFLDDLLTT